MKLDQLPLSVLMAIQRSMAYAESDEREARLGFYMLVAELEEEADREPIEAEDWIEADERAIVLTFPKG